MLIYGLGLGHLQPDESIGTLIEMKVSGLDHLAVMGRICTLGSIGQKLKMNVHACDYNP